MSRRRYYMNLCIFKMKIPVNSSTYIFGYIYKMPYEMSILVYFYDCFRPTIGKIEMSHLM